MGREAERNTVHTVTQSDHLSHNSHVFVEGERGGIVFFDSQVPQLTYQ